MSTTVSSAPLKSHKKSKAVEFTMTAFAVIFTVMPLVVMAMWVLQYIDFSGAGSLVHDILHGVFGAKDQ